MPVRPPSLDAVDYSTAPAEPIEFVPVDPPAGERLPYPEAFRGRIAIDVIHDGHVIPEEYLVDARGRRIRRETLWPHYVRERDWGASIVAARLCEKLHIPGFLRVNTARCLLDFGRFPGITRKGASHLRRFAINYPFSELLGYAQKRRLLEEHYDRISAAMDHAISGALFKIAVHTYDRLNASGTERPQVSIVTRSLSYQVHSEMPFGLFDPLYPDILAEFTCDRILRDRLSLTLEKAGIPVAHNYPYLLPEGSPEVRHQVLAFFDFLQRRFEAEFPSTRTRPEYALVWEMLKDTNLRSAEAGTLRSVLHLYRRPPESRRREFEFIEAAYRHVEEFLRREDGQIVDEYRFLDDRPSSLGIEVRKDLAFSFDERGQPRRPSTVRAWYIADTIARAIIVYLNEDRAPHHLDEERFSQRQPWYRGAGEAVGDPPTWQ